MDTAQVELMRINWGCGRRVLDGFYNIDAQHNPKAPRPPELIHALEFNRSGFVKEPIPLPDKCASEVHGYHVLEHVFIWEAPHLLAEWRRLLCEGGKLVLELPDLEKACRNLLNGRSEQMWLWPLYGDGSHKDPYMMHKHGYTPRSLRELLEEHGFKDIQFKDPQTHGKRHDRDMRCEAVKR